MTPHDLEHIERAFDKAKMAGPQALHDWAVQYAPQLFAQARLGFDEFEAVEQVASDHPANDAPAFNYGDPRRLNDALRPFAAFGAPPVLAALDAAREFIGAGEETPVFAVVDSDGATAIASISRAQCVAAHDLINEIDGGGGA